MPQLQSSRQRIALSAGFTPMREIVDGQHKSGTMVSVMGLITDFRAPIATRGSDWKCQIRLYDQSIEDESDDSLLLNVFRPENEMPEARCGDIAVIFATKVQRYQSESYSLCTSWSTDIHIYLAGKIPDPPREASSALRPPTKKIGRQPSEAENAAVSTLYRSIDKSRVPTEAEFEVMKVQSLNVQDKFCLLKDVRDGRFADSVVQIVKDPYDLGEKFTLWVSDYTENPLFFAFAFKGGLSGECQDGDPFGYLTKFSTGPSQSEWGGPFGKRSMQITCYEPHASMIRERALASGSWISLRNLQIKYGHNGSNLEGFLREDRGAQGVKINIIPLDPAEDPETISPRLKEAIRRKRDYERLKKTQLKGITEAAKAGVKRKSNAAHEAQPPKLNSKSRRKASRTQAVQKVEEEQVVNLPVGNLNPQGRHTFLQPVPVSASPLTRPVKCESQTKAASSVADILEQIYQDTNIGGQLVKLQLPFINANYRTHVRVVNFMPPKLEDFAVVKKTSEYDALSDNDESDSGSDSEQDVMTKYTAERHWEWRFYLELQDAAVADGQPKECVWVLVDNPAAQLLMNLNASNLRQGAGNLEALRQRMFLLWGDLEERNTQAAKQARARRAAEKDGPPPNSSDDEGRGEKTTQVSNCPFSCCIRQYGVKVSEADKRKADAGDGKRWQRVFGLFGTKISGP